MPYFFHAIFIIDGNDGNLTFSPTKIRNRQTIFIILLSIINSKGKKVTKNASVLYTLHV
jgi:hypothetical protein